MAKYCFQPPPCAKFTVPFVNKKIVKLIQIYLNSLLADLALVVGLPRKLVLHILAERKK